MEQELNKLKDQPLEKVAGGAEEGQPNYWAQCPKCGSSDVTCLDYNPQNGHYLNLCNVCSNIWETWD